MRHRCQNGSAVQAGGIEVNTLATLVVFGFPPEYALSLAESPRLLLTICGDNSPLRQQLTIGAKGIYLF
jgi:hypothetical protein